MATRSSSRSSSATSTRREALPGRRTAAGRRSAPSPGWASRGRAREVVARRLARLSAEANQPLTAAAAFEGEFRFEVVAGLAGLNEDDALDALDEALDAQILAPPGDADTYAFTHALIRHTLYGGLAPPAGPGFTDGPPRPWKPCRVDARLCRRDRRPVPPQPWPSRAPSVASSMPWRPPTMPRPRAPTTKRPVPAHGPRPAPDGDPHKPRLLGRLGIVLAWALAFDDAVEAAGQAGDAIAEAEAKQRRRSTSPTPPTPSPRPAASWPPGTSPARGLTYAGARDVAWARLVVLRLRAPGGRGPRSPGDPHRQPRAPGGGPHPPGGPPGPARPGADGGRLRLPRRGGTSARTSSSSACGAASTGDRSRSSRRRPARPRPSVGWPERPGPGQRVLQPGRPRAAGRGSSIAGAGRRPGAGAWERRFRPPSTPSSFPASRWTRAGSGSSRPSRSWPPPTTRRWPGRSALPAGAGPEAAAHAGRPAEALEAFRPPRPLAGAGPGVDGHLPAMACRAADVLWLLERLITLDVVERPHCGRK